MPDPPFIAPNSYCDGDLTIRPYRPGDGVALQPVAVSSFEHLQPWMPWAKADQTVDETEAICRRAAARYLLNEDFTLAICLGDEIAGGTGFHRREGPLESHSAEIGMWISVARAGQGLGARVLRAMLTWGFTEWPWQRLSWHCDPRNLASARVAEKNGLTLEGTLRSNSIDVDGNRRDTHIYALLREEWHRRAQTQP